MFKVSSSVVKDVVIIGGGPAGVSAAIAAARSGVKTLLIERTHSLGGMLTGSLIGKSMGSWRVYPQEIPDLISPHSYYSGKQAVKGIGQEMADRLVQIDGAYGKIGEVGAAVAADPEALSYVLDQMVLEANVEVWLGTTLIDAERENGGINQVFVHNKSGIHALRGRVFIDATGDGDLAHLAGAGYVKGREADGVTMPVSLVFILGNVELEKTIKYLSENRDDALEWGTPEEAARCYREGHPLILLGFRKLIDKAYRNGDLPLARGAESHVPLCAIHSIFKQGQIQNNMTGHITDMAYKVDVTNSSDLTEGIFAARKRSRDMLMFFRKYVPGYEEAFIVQTGSQLGLRESRRIIGEYTLTEKDVLEGRQFEDAIALSAGSINVHSEGGGKTDTDGGGRVYTLLSEPYQIPYRTLIPKDLTNLLVAGRAISVDRGALGSIRDTPICMAIGQGAGVAAALAVKTEVSIRNIDKDRLRTELVGQGVAL